MYCRLRLLYVWSDCMFDICFEFDELYSLVGQMGFSGKDLDTMVGFILHSINEKLRSEIENEKHKI